MNPKMEAFVNGYIECALWSSNDVSDDNPDHKYETLQGLELDDQARLVLTSHAVTFYWQHFTLLHAAIEACNQVWEQAGHDLWLTHNGHGSGFWDGDWGEPAQSWANEGPTFGDVLTLKAHTYKQIDLYVGDYDGKVYV